MTDPFRKVSPGEALEIPADTYNLLLSSAQIYQRQKIGTGGGPPLAFPIDPANTCLVQNMTGAALPAGSVLAYGTPLITPPVNQFEAQKRPAFQANAPTSASAPFVITWDAMTKDSPNNIGRAVVSGLAVAQVNITDTSHKRAKPIPGDTTKLASAASGGVPIVWSESGTGVKWAFVLLDSGDPSLLSPDCSTFVDFDPALCLSIDSLGLQLLNDPTATDTWIGDGLATINGYLWELEWTWPQTSCCPILKLTMVSSGSGSSSGGSGSSGSGAVVYPKWIGCAQGAMRFASNNSLLTGATSPSCSPTTTQIFDLSCACEPVAYTSCPLDCCAWCATFTDLTGEHPEWNFRVLVDQVMQTWGEVVQFFDVCCGGSGGSMVAWKFAIHCTVSVDNLGHSTYKLFSYLEEPGGNGGTGLSYLPAFVQTGTDSIGNPIFEAIIEIRPCITGGLLGAGGVIAIRLSPQSGDCTADSAPPDCSTLPPPPPPAPPPPPPPPPPFPCVRWAGYQGGGPDGSFICLPSGFDPNGDPAYGYPAQSWVNLGTCCNCSTGGTC